MWDSLLNSRLRCRSMSRLFNIVVTAEGAHHGDGTDENYTFQAYAPNGEVLTFKGTGYTLADAAVDFAESVRSSEARRKT
jgi:hypothetical protein